MIRISDEELDQGEAGSSMSLIALIGVSACAERTTSRRGCAGRCLIGPRRAAGRMSYGHPVAAADQPAATTTRGGPEGPPLTS